MIAGQILFITSNRTKRKEPQEAAPFPLISTEIRPL